MISDSVPWREHLWKAAAALEKRASSVRWTDRTSFLVERDLMNGMFAIRRLIESAKSHDAGFATYEPFPDASDPASMSQLRAAFPSLAWSPLSSDH